MKKTKRLRQLLAKDGIIVAPGAYDCLSATLVEQAGFDAIYMTGAGISNCVLGFPDIGLATLTEMIEQATRICNATNIPVIADADTGYGNVVNVRRTVREYERAGVAAIHIEDQIFPKRCGHFEGKNIISKEEAVAKIKAAVAAREDPDFVIIARTDARAVEGLDSAIDRGKAFLEAGADVLFIEAPQSIEELRLIGKTFNAPLLANMVEGGKTPVLPAKELEKLGFKIVIHAGSGLRFAAKAMQELFRELKRTGTTLGMLDRMISWQERLKLTRLEEFDAWGNRFSS